jgi:hypothetical protein
VLAISSLKVLVKNARSFIDAFVGWQLTAHFHEKSDNTMEYIGFYWLLLVSRWRVGLVFGGMGIGTTIIIVQLVSAAVVEPLKMT